MANQKEFELNRLRAIIFEGAPDWVKWAAMDDDGEWNWYEHSPINSSNKDYFWMYDTILGNLTKCKNQPETFLNWTDCLIRRSDD